MKIKTRFIKSVVETARKSETELPWTRGTRRAAFLAARTEKDTRRVARAS